jgi:hypothetical protein
MSGFERVNDELDRIVVPGGWIYRSCMIGIYGYRAIAMAFAPDPDAGRNFRPASPRPPAHVPPPPSDPI